MRLISLHWGKDHRQVCHTIWVLRTNFTKWAAMTPLSCMKCSAIHLHSSTRDWIYSFLLLDSHLSHNLYHLDNHRLPAARTKVVRTHHCSLLHRVSLLITIWSQWTVESSSLSLFRTVYRRLLDLVWPPNSRYRSWALPLLKQISLLPRHTEVGIHTFF